MTTIPRWTKEPKCSECIALCCRLSVIHLSADHPEDAQVIAEGNAVADHADQGGRPVMRKVDGKCVYLSDDNRCSIYERRPTACRMYDCRRNAEYAKLSAQGLTRMSGEPDGLRTSFVFRFALGDAAFTSTLLNLRKVQARNVPASTLRQIERGRK